MHPRLNPAPDAAFVSEIFLSELALEISLFTCDDEAIYENDADWHCEQHPRGIYQDRDCERHQSQADVHWIAAKTIKSMHDDPRARVEGNRVSAGPLLGNESADVQRSTNEKDKRANRPPERAMHETGRNEPFECERRQDRKNE